MTIASIQNNYMHTPLVSKNNTDNNFNQNSDNKENKNMKDIQNQDEQNVQKDRHLSKEEARMLLVQYQATQVMKNQIDTYFDVEEEEGDELNFSDIRDVNKMLNRAELLKHYDEERVRIQEKEKQIELWA